MKLCLAGFASNISDENAVLLKDISCILESYAYLKGKRKEAYIPQFMGCKHFILDSGAFTFIQGSCTSDFERYLDEYISFIVKHQVRHFVELDVDCVLGYERVKQMRRRLENEVGQQCIPVWHRSRGIAEFKTMVHEYSYIAIGGFAIKSLKEKEYPQIFEMVRYAHAHNTMVHGLGFTQTKYLPICGFDSVDSTTWVSGRRFGHIFEFLDGAMKVHPPPKGKRVGNYRAADLHNLREWMKLQKYAERHW